VVSYSTSGANISGGGTRTINGQTNNYALGGAICGITSSTAVSGKIASDVTNYIAACGFAGSFGQLNTPTLSDPTLTVGFNQLWLQPATALLMLIGYWVPMCQLWQLATCGTPALRLFVTLALAALLSLSSGISQCSAQRHCWNIY